MKKTIFILLFSLQLSLKADQIVVAQDVVKLEYKYLQVGAIAAPFPIANLGIGQRIQSGYHGVDISIQGSTIGILKTSSCYCYYPYPDYFSETYLGIGAAFGASPFFPLFLTPEFVIGKQSLKEDHKGHFYQAKLNFPSVIVTQIGKPDAVFPIPLVSFNYGIAF